MYAEDMHSAFGHGYCSEAMSRAADLLEAQVGTITALNIALGGKDSTSTENLVDSHEIDIADVGLITMCRKLMAETGRSREPCDKPDGLRRVPRVRAGGALCGDPAAHDVRRAAGEDLSGRADLPDLLPSGGRRDHRIRERQVPAQPRHPAKPPVP